MFQKIYFFEFEFEVFQQLVIVLVSKQLTLAVVEKAEVLCKNLP